MSGAADRVTASSRAEESLGKNLGKDWAEEREASGDDGHVDLDASPHIVCGDVAGHLSRCGIILEGCDDDKDRCKTNTFFVSIIL